MLLEFDRRQAAGEDAANISFGEIVGNRYRYMQARGRAALPALPRQGSGR